MKERVVKIILGLAVVGLMAVPFSYSVYCASNDKYGTQDDDDDDHDSYVVEDIYHENDYKWENTTAGKMASDTTVAAFALGEQYMPGAGNAGGGVKEVFPALDLSYQVEILGADLSNGEMPYCAVKSEVGPVAKGILQGEALSRGFIPGGILDVQIGVFRAGVCTVSNKLNKTYPIHVGVNPPLPGYKYAVLALFPEGGTKLYDGSDENFIQSDIVGDSAYDPVVPLTINTMSPRCVYMIVQVPAR